MKVGDVERVAVVGAGFMGHGIGQEFAAAGYRVVLQDVSQDQLDLARRRIERNLAELADWGIVPAGVVDPALDRITYTTDLREAAATDLVIEAVYEDLELKQDIFRALDALAPARTILGSNTSTFMPSTLAAVTERPDRVLGIHYFYPPSLLPLVEVVRGPDTSEETVDTVLGLLRRVGKRPIVVQKEALGFIANRLQFALQREALYIVEQGIADPEDVDRAVKDGFGRRLAVAGPFEIAEPIGWDLEIRIQRILFPDLCASPEPSPLVVEKVERGELGVKTGRGFYEWTEESAEAWRQQMAEALREQGTP